LRRIKAADRQAAPGSWRMETAMSIKTIVTLANGSDADALALSFAVHIARDHAASIKVVATFPEMEANAAAFGPSLSAGFAAGFEEAMAKSREQTRTAIRKMSRLACEASGIPFNRRDCAPGLFIEPENISSWLAVTHGVGLTDLVVVSHAGLDQNDIVSDALQRLRVPLFVARGSAERLNGIVVIAWDGSLEASRAVRAALPFLQRAPKVIALQVTSGLDPLADSSFDTLTQYLALHGVPTVECGRIEGREVGPALHAAALAHDAAILVAGAYSHSRLQESLFGGATHALLTPKGGPCLLLAH
jgi:nucleotide-binding universal stress UspA family protein